MKTAHPNGFTETAPDAGMQVDQIDCKARLSYIIDQGRMKRRILESKENADGAYKYKNRVV